MATMTNYSNSIAIEVGEPWCQIVSCDGHMLRLSKCPGVILADVVQAGLCMKDGDGGYRPSPALAQELTAVVRKALKGRLTPQTRVVVHFTSIDEISEVCEESLRQFKCSNVEVEDDDA